MKYPESTVKTSADPPNPLVAYGFVLAEKLIYLIVGLNYKTERVMENLRHILKHKGASVWSIGPDETVYRALQMMAEKEIGALLVLDGEKVVGIFSERDYARKVILQGRSSANTKISELMIKDVIYGSPDDPIQESMAVMTENKIRHLPVIEDGRLCGMVTSGDIINHIISRQKFEIEALKKYITGGY